ncbi:uncharacterized protein LOC115876018 [Sitophilus oryzae]|uniref:Uncharacterized protein LOC115876018 n=1 Tax=Sitophilus oryzae TaxID=7048 RepID=A0A6J2X8I2_SITOR|nr:uncharacterized protein LOC115876018 [Sitophilus oryzae]
MLLKLAGIIFGSIFLLNYVNGQFCECKNRASALGLSDAPVEVPPGSWVVRPKSLQKPAVILPLYGSLFKGPCFRRHTIVKPAVVTNPVYLQDTSTLVPINPEIPAHESPSPVVLPTFSKPEGYQAIDVANAYQQACTGNVLPSAAPADAVSLALAYKLAQNSIEKKIAEDKLYFGFKKLPIEQPCPKIVAPKITKQLLPEGSLYTLNGEIVELKAPKEADLTPEDLEQEAAEELIDLALSEEYEASLPPVKQPSLTELGYAPAKIKAATFVDIPSYPASRPAPVSQPVVSAAPCNDGFQAGSVIVEDIPAESEPVIKKIEKLVEALPAVVCDIPQ